VKLPPTQSTGPAPLPPGRAGLDNPARIAELAGVLATLACLFLHAGTAAPEDPPSVVVIVLDDVGWTEVPLMPSLAALAQRGTTFARFYSMPYCTPTRMAITFGRYPRREGVGWLLNAHDLRSPRLSLELLSIAELFKPSHRTALIGKQHLGRAPLRGPMDQPTSEPYAQGWDHWRAGNLTGLGADPDGEDDESGAEGYYRWRRVTDGAVQISTEYAVDAERDEFLAYWRATSGPRLVQLAVSAAHYPYQAPPGYADQPELRGDYENIIRYLDAQLATVLAAVDLERSFVVILSDNGTPEAVRAPGVPAGVSKPTTFEGGIRVPLVVAGPGVRQGVTSERLVSAVDVPATLAELVGIRIGRGFDDSQSFANELGAWPGTQPRAFVFSERFGEGVGGQPFDEQAIVETSLKLVRADPDGPGPRPAQDSFYALPGEARASPAPAERDRLVRALASLPPRAVPAVVEAPPRERGRKSSPPDRK
jgi:arylsulfatase A-like enzyme